MQAQAVRSRRLALPSPRRAASGVAERCRGSKIQAALPDGLPYGLALRLGQNGVPVILGKPIANPQDRVVDQVLNRFDGVDPVVGRTIEHVCQYGAETRDLRKQISEARWILLKPVRDTEALARHESGN